MFGLPQLLPDDHLDFTAAKTKLERDADQLMRTFKEHIDLEANYQTPQNHQQIIAKQEGRLMQESACLKMCVRIYYMKQIQDKQNFMHDKAQVFLGAGLNTQWTPLMFDDKMIIKDKKPDEKSRSQVNSMVSSTSPKLRMNRR